MTADRIPAPVPPAAAWRCSECAVAQCSECLAEFRLKKDGTLRWHLGSVYYGSGRWRQVCDGVGKPPAVMHDPLAEGGWARALIESEANLP